MARYMRSYGKSTLRPPEVIGGGIAWHGPGTYLTNPNFVQERYGRRRAKSRLEPPTVVTPAAPTQVFFGPKVYLNVMLPERQRSTITRRRPTYQLFPPVILQTNLPTRVHLTYSRRGKARPTYVYPIVVLGTQAWGYTAIQYVRRPRPSTRSFLRPAILAAAVAAQVYFGPSVHLARARRPLAKSSLKPPTILQSNLRTKVTLARVRSQAKAKSFLRAPTDTVGLEDQGRIETRFAPQRRGRTTYFLSPPTDTVGLEDQGKVTTRLTKQHRTVARYHLQPPTVVFGAVEIYGPVVVLARIKPPPTVALLKPPTDVLDANELNLGPEVNLTYSRRGRPVYVLHPFSTGAFDVYTGPSVTLAPSKRGTPKSSLAPPAVVAPVVSYGPLVELAPSFRGKPKSSLKAPTVVDQPPAYQQVLPPTLTYSRRGEPKSFLRPPTAVFPFIARPAIVSLAPQTRGKPKSILRAPAILRTGGTLSITLAPQRRGRPLSFLKAPTVVRAAAVYFGPVVELTYSRRGRPLYRLIPPAVVGKEPFRGIILSLAPSRRPRTLSFRQQERVGHPPLAPVSIHLTRIRPRKTLALVKRPTVVGAGVAFYGPQVTLVRIRPPRVIHLRLPLVVSPFRPPRGDVCGFDIAGSFVCELQLPGSQVSGSDSAGHGVTGASSAGSTVTGSDSAGGSVSGSDRKAT